ncbi:MAG: hypothetical protein AB1646_12200 [Thermodesulfobacteriota bacterium]
MAKAIEQIRKSGGWSLTVGHFGLGARGDGVGSVGQQVHDGDTINVRALGNFGVRFLGIDAPEISLALPGGGPAFVPLSDQRWEDFLTDPFAGSGGTELKKKLPPGLLEHLQRGAGPGAAGNQFRHAEAAKQELRSQVEKDLQEVLSAPEEFRFFLVFASEIMDRYGRLLAFINREARAEPRPLDYNQRLLKNGMVSPYFIWPNVNPFRKQASLLEAVPAPGTANELANSERTLREARAWTQNARRTRTRGIFEEHDPLRLHPFEVRFLAGRRPPERRVIDLGKNDDVLIPALDYHTVGNIEDRLFIPTEYVALFKEKGWRAP